MKKARQVIRTTFVLIAIPAVLSLFAAHYRSNATLVTRTWDGGGVTNNWSDAANWSGDVVPTSDDSAVFDSTSTKNCTIDVNIPGPLLINLNAGYSGALTMAPEQCG